MSNWFQDNLRIIISVGIVILLVFAIYSYSKRDSRTNVVVDDSQIEEVAMTAPSSDGNEINEIIDEIKDEEVTKEVAVAIKTEEITDGKGEIEAKIALEKKIAEEAAEAQKKAQEEAQQAKAQADKEAKEIEAARAEAEAQKAKEAAKTAEAEAKIALEQKLAKEAAEQVANNTNDSNTDTQTAKDVVRKVIESHSKEKEGVIVVVAVSGDSKTTLARKATAEYIQKNNVSGLTPAHKIYIEDYIRKATQASSIQPGTEMGFSNDLINSAIESSRILTGAQLNNLNKYVITVSTL